MFKQFSTILLLKVRIEMNVTVTRSQLVSPHQSNILSFYIKTLKPEKFILDSLNDFLTNIITTVIKRCTEDD